MGKRGYIYIITNVRHTVLYTGVTSNLSQRISQHKLGSIPGFASTYQCKRLVYYEVHDSIESAIAREKYIKGKKRVYKENLINSINPEWKDLPALFD